MKIKELTNLTLGCNVVTPEMFCVIFIVICLDLHQNAMVLGCCCWGWGGGGGGGAACVICISALFQIV